MKKKIRIIMAKPGLDGHDRGIKILARAFRDAGMEVIYLGLRQTPEMIVNAAVEEDADIIALSILSGAHMTIFRKIRKLMNDSGLTNVLLTGGGIIPEADMETLSQLGVGKLFGPGTPLLETITGSTIKGGRFFSLKNFATHSITPALKSMPVLEAEGFLPANTASSCLSTMADFTGSMPRIFLGVCAVTAVTTLAPCTPNVAKVLRSACRPAPQLESDPAIVSATGLGLTRLT